MGVTVALVEKCFQRDRPFIIRLFLSNYLPLQHAKDVLNHIDVDLLLLFVPKSAISGSNRSFQLKPLLFKSIVHAIPILPEHFFKLVQVFAVFSRFLVHHRHILIKFDSAATLLALCALLDFELAIPRLVIGGVDTFDASSVFNAEGAICQAESFPPMLDSDPGTAPTS